jgi:capsular exopolysaccharide synthesis family protein
VGLIRQARDLLKNDLAQQEDMYSSFRQTSPLVASGTDEVNPLQDRLSSIEVQRSELLLRRANIEWQLLALERAKQAGGGAQQLLARVTEMRQQATTENGLPSVSTALESQLIQLVDDERGLLEHYGPNHPHVLTMRQRIAGTRHLFALPTTAHMPVPESGDASETSSVNRDPVVVYTQYLQQELEGLEISEGLLANLYDHEHDAAKEHSIFQLKDERYRRGIESTEALYDVVINRLQEASLIKDFGGFETRIIAPPRLGQKVSPSRRIILPVAAFAGILLGCMLAVVAEFRDDSFQSCDQVQQQLGLPVVGQIPQFAAAPETAVMGVHCDPMLCTYYQPRSLSAESFRTLRTALYFNSLGESSRVTQVTGAGAEDGASTVAANLAISLAQTGKRVLLIDADLRKQRQHQMFGIACPETGLAAIIASDVEPGDAICQTAVDNLWLLPAGPLPEGPCELFTSPRFGELINLVRDSYDHVLIDTEPLLVASDPCVIASQTDGVVLTLRLTRDSRQRAKRAKQMLDRLDASMLGVVVNRMSGAILKRHQRERRDYALTSGDVPPSSRTEQRITVG